MGANTDAMDYDDNLIFKPLVFYLDTHKNAEANGLKVPNKGISEDALARMDQLSVILSHSKTVRLT